MGSLRRSLGMDGPAVCGEVYVILLYQGACDSLFPPSCSILTPKATPGSSAGHRPPVPSLRVEALVPPTPAERDVACRVRRRPRHTAFSSSPVRRVLIGKQGWAPGKVYSAVTRVTT